jgi:hypothetical protein
MRSFIAITAVSLACCATDNTHQFKVGFDDQIIPQVVDGGGWQTTIRLANLAPGAVHYQLLFFADDGSALSLPLTGIGTFSAVTGVIAPGGTATIRTLGEGSSTVQGWVQLDMDGLIGGFAVVSQRAPGGRTEQASIPISSRFSADFAIAFDNTGPLTTAVALVNPSAFEAANVTVLLRDETGVEFARDTFTLQPLAHSADTLAHAYPMTVGRRGMAEFVTFATQLSGVGLLFDANGGFSYCPALRPE